MKKEQLSTYQKARLKVLAIKGFYQHLITFVLISVLMLAFKNGLLDFIIAKTQVVHPEFINWLDINIKLAPIIWGVVIAVHGLIVFSGKFNPIKNWENRKMKEYLNEENDIKRYL